MNGYFCLSSRFLVFDSFTEITQSSNQLGMQIDKHSHHEAPFLRSFVHWWLCLASSPRLASPATRQPPTPTRQQWKWKPPKSRRLSKAPPDEENENDIDPHVDISIISNYLRFSSLPTGSGAAKRWGAGGGSAARSRGLLKNALIGIGIRKSRRDSP